jgi:predicted PolB exonuclease-like 3'-5' exonuclease
MTTIRIWDIETGPAPADELEAIAPTFEAPKNLKDPAKIEAAIAEKRADWFERAALSPITGRVLCIGFADPSTGTTWTIGDQPHLDERAIVARFFDSLADCAMGSAAKLVGWNVHGFDLPFLVKRAWALGIHVPPYLRPSSGSRFYWPSWLVDMRQIWGLGEHQPEGSLDVVARYLGVGRKNGEGKDFARLFHGTTEQRKQALDYLENDVRLTMAVARRLGVIEEATP